MKVARVCPCCASSFEAEISAVNRAAKLGYDVRCSRECSGTLRRKNKSVEQRKLEKAAYDSQYRDIHRARILAAKRESHKRNYEPVQAAIVRAKRMPWHVQYCRRPDYVRWKRSYDQTHRAKKIYGPFSEAFKALLALEAEVAARGSWHDVATQKGTINKKQTRRRYYDRTYSI